MSKQLAQQIIVIAKATFVPEQSEPAEQKFIWSYDITIENKSEDIVQLLNRYWKITDMTSHIEEIHGIGVVGLQPLIKPGKYFTYTSYCQLMTPQGTMEGFYEMQDLEEVRFNASVPKFILSAPASITQSFRSRLH